jgi:ABC-type lipoprotein release transport system permease subunit
MRRVALKGIWWRRGRAVLTAFAVVLGVAMVSGTFILTDTINKAFDGIFQDSYSKTSAVISGREVVKEATSGTATVPVSLLDRVRANGNVAEASGAIFNLNDASSTKLLDKDNKALGSANNGQFGFGFDARAERFNPLVLTDGRWASGTGQVVIDNNTAKDNGYSVGDRIGVAARGPTRQYTITGLARYGKENSIGGATIAVFDVPTAQALLGKRGQYDTIFIAAKDGVSSEQLVQDLRPVLPAAAQIKTGQQQADANSKDSQEQSKFVQYFLLAFGFIALGVGAFVIFNTLSITLAQRIRELATLRTLGASRRQIRRSVMTEGLVMGVFASVVGLERRLQGVRHRPAQCFDRGRAAHHHRGAGAGHRRHPDRQHLARSAGHPDRTGRRVARGRHPATTAGRACAGDPRDVAGHRRRLQRGGCLGRSRRDRHLDDPRRRRRPGALPGRDHDRRPHRASAGPGPRWPGAALRWAGRPAGQQQRHPKHDANGDHRRRADDRAGTGHARRHPRRRAARLDAQRRREGGQRRLRRDLQGWVRDRSR